MPKIGRNDLCPCGSDKKFKKCCLTTHTNVENGESTNMELSRVHQDLILTVTHNKQITLQEQFKKHESPLIKDDETRDIYHTGLTPWIVSSVSDDLNKETIIDAYVRKNNTKISLPIRTMLDKWVKRAPSIYEAISIDTPKKGLLLIEELKTEERFYIPFQNEDDFIEGSLLLGTLVPFATYESFLFTMVKLYHRDKQYYSDLLTKYAEKDGGLKKQYPPFLAEALSHGSTINQWKSQDHEEVAHLFADHMIQKNMSDRVIMDGIMEWNAYCEKNNPSIQKIEVYVAALDYYMQHTFLENMDVKQVELAEEYNISPSTLSRIYRQMIHELVD